MDLELMKYLVSIAFILLLLMKQYFDGIKLDRRHGEATEVFRAMPKLTESAVSCQTELCQQMRLMTRQMEALKLSLECLAERFSVAPSSNIKE